MPELSRAQLLVYGAIGVVLLLVGVRWIRSAEDGGEAVGAGEGAGVAIASGRDAGGSDPGAAGGVAVHVAGAVRKPGVYRLPEGARVEDAVERAGGATGEATVDAINLAARLADGQQVVVPERGPGGVAVAPPGVAGAGAADGPISLGAATVEQLETIDGIGPVTAQKIIDFRDRSGGVGAIEELEEVSGIGPATIESLRDRLQP